MNQQELDEIQKLTSELISDLGIGATVKVNSASSLSEAKEEMINVQVDSEQAASLIGFHGEALQSLQLIVSFLAHKSLGKWFKVLLNVGDYRQKREEQLQKLALNLAMKAKFSGEQQVIPNLTAAERRIIHLALADRTDIYTQSEGEGKQRQLTIRPKTNQ